MEWSTAGTHRNIYLQSISTLFRISGWSHFCHWNARNVTSYRLFETTGAFFFLLNKFIPLFEFKWFIWMKEHCYWVTIFMQCGFWNPFTCHHFLNQYSANTESLFKNFLEGVVYGNHANRQEIDFGVLCFTNAPNNENNSMMSAIQINGQLLHRKPDHVVQHRLLSAQKRYRASFGVQFRKRHMS